jgi:hypothetical protein
MANDTSREEQKESSSARKKALIALAVGSLVVFAVYFFFKTTRPELLEPLISQDSFQGPAELSAAVQVSCQESAKKIFAEINCSEKEVEFSKSAANCLSVYYSIDTDKATAEPEGNYGDISLHIAKCFAEVNSSKEQAADWLKKVNELYDWDVSMGPITCDSKSTLAATIESYSEVRAFKCLKIADIQSLVSDIKSKNWDRLRQMLPADGIAHQGLIEADISCPETIANIEKNLNQMLSEPFEVTEPKLEDGAPDDIFIEVTRNGARILNLQFKVKSDGCLHFQSLLGPSSEIE